MSEFETPLTEADTVDTDSLRVETAPLQTAPDEEDTSETTEIAPVHAPYDTPENGVLFFVISGLHEGATFRMPKEGATVGSSYDCDLILSDDTVEETHLRIAGKETAFGYVASVTCEGTGVLINGRVPMEQGESRDFSANFVITIGNDVSVRVLITRMRPIESVFRKYCAPQIEALNEKKRFLQGAFSKENLIDDRRNLALSVLSGTFFLFLSYHFLFGAEEVKPPLRGGGNMSVSPASNSANLAQYRKTLDIAEQDLKKVLEKYNLHKRLNVKNFDETLYISGSINSYENEQWAKVQNWYDSIYSKRVNLVTLIDLNNGARRTISFKAVVPDEKEPFVVSWTGDRYRPGATLPGGWIILAVRADGVLVKDAVENRTYLVEHIRSPVGSAVQLPRILESDL